MTGSIQSVNGKELADLPVSSIAQKLQGRLAGVQINQTTGRPGQGMNVRIRANYQSPEEVPRSMWWMDFQLLEILIPSTRMKSRTFLC
ncbi:TonB-dependent receptor plug domain-containing protein [Algoriphagus boritolerans]|uniref:TonB-dependent receptor plug domain-containing protein n=1 Tax=Algoriphagus boritolerans TaxID=308111 RepID=UPI002FCE55A5